MNKLEDFTEGGEWLSLSGRKLFFHSLNKPDRVVSFTSNEEHPFSHEKGIISFRFGWKHFKKVDK